MKREELRPVGTEFEITYPPSPESTSAVWTTVRYRVSEHREVSVYGREDWAEVWVPVDTPGVLAFLVTNNEA